MAWGDPTVTRRRIQSDSSIGYSTGSTLLSVQHVGMLKRVLFRLNGVVAYTKSGGGSTADAQGPFNTITQLQMKVNGIGTFLDCSYYHLYLYNLIHYARNNYDPSSSDNTGIQQTQTASNLFAGTTVPGASGNITLLAQLYYPLTMEVAGIKEIGLWTLQNDEVNLEVRPTWNATAMSATALTGPFDLAGGDSATFTAASTSLDVVREFYAVPKNKSDYPVTGWFHQLVAQRVAMTTTTTEFAVPKGGVIVRGIYNLISGGTSLMTNANVSRIKWVYGSNEIPFDESATDVLARQRVTYGHDLPIGTYTHDFWAMGNQTFRDAYDTNEYQNLRVRIETPSTPAAGSYADVIIERMIPIRGDAEKLW